MDPNTISDYLFILFYFFEEVCSNGFLLICACYQPIFYNLYDKESLKRKSFCCCCNTCVILRIMTGSILSSINFWNTCLSSDIVRLLEVPIFGGKFLQFPIFCFKSSSSFQNKFVISAVCQLNNWTRQQKKRQ
jgi:hypothetical protein